MLFAAFAMWMKRRKLRVKLQVQGCVSFAIFFPPKYSVALEVKGIHIGIQ